MLAYALLALLLSYLLVRIFIHLKSKYTGRTNEALPRPISASAQTTTFLSLPGLRSGSGDEVQLGTTSKTGNASAKTTATGMGSWTWTKRPWTSISLPSLSLPRMRLPWARTRRFFAARGGSSGNGNGGMGIGGGGSLLSSDDEDDVQDMAQTSTKTPSKAKSKNLFRPNPIELLPTTALPPHPLASPVSVSRPSTPRAPRVAVGGVASESGPGSPPHAPLLVPMSPPPAELLVDIGETRPTHLYPPPLAHKQPSPPPAATLPPQAIYTPAPRPFHPTHAHNAFAHAAARLATTPPPAPHKRSRSLGGVPVRRLSSGAGSGLRNAVGDEWDEDARLSEKEMRGEEERERKRARGELLIDFDDAETQTGIVRSTSESTSASDIGTVMTVGKDAPLVPLVSLKPVGPPASTCIYGAHTRHGWDDDNEEDEESWKWFARGPPGLMKAAEITGRGTALVPVYRSTHAPTTISMPIPMTMPVPMKTIATTTTPPNFIPGTAASTLSPALTTTSDNTNSDSSSMQLIDISPAGESRLEEGVLVDVSYDSGAYDDYDEERIRDGKLEKQELLVDIEGQNDPWTSAYASTDVFGGSNVWDDDIEEGHLDAVEAVADQHQHEHVHLESSPAASPLRATEAEELELELGNVPMLDLGALDVEQTKSHLEEDEEEDELTPVSTRSIMPPSPYLVPLPSFVSSAESESEEVDGDVYPDPDLLPLPSPTKGDVYTYAPKVGEFGFGGPIAEDPELPVLPSPPVDVDVDDKLSAPSQTQLVLPEKEKEVVSPISVTRELERELEREREPASPPQPPRISLSQTPTPPASPPPSFVGQRSLMKGLGISQLQIPAVVVHQAQVPVNIDFVNSENEKAFALVAEKGSKENDATPNRTPTGLRPAWSIRAADAPALGIPSPTAGRKVLGDVSFNTNTNTSRETVSVEVVKVQKMDEEGKEGDKTEEKVDLKEAVIETVPAVTEEEKTKTKNVVDSLPNPTEPEARSTPDADDHADDNTNTDINASAAAAAKEAPSTPTLEPSTSLPGAFPEASPTIAVSPPTSVPFPSSSDPSTTTTPSTTSTLSHRIRSASLSLRGSGTTPPWSLPSARHIIRSPLDIALAMQMRPGLGAGADPAWMVRFLMAVYGWVLVSVAGGDY